MKLLILFLSIFSLFNVSLADDDLQAKRAKFEKELRAALEKRANFDLDCEKPIKLMNLGGGSWGAKGCKQSTTYLVQCKSEKVDTDCQIIKNDATKSK